MATKKKYTFGFFETKIKQIDKIAKKKDFTRTQMFEFMIEKAILNEFGFEIDINEDI
jgi:hypothetical protein